MDDKTTKILLIEDNAADARFVREILKESSFLRFKLVHRVRLEEALKCLREASFDVLLLDLSLPDSHGIDSFNIICTQDQTVPIIVLTGLNDEELAIKLVRAGAQDYLVKGQFDNNLLTRSIRYAIERKKTEEALKLSERELAIRNKIASIFLTTPDDKIYGEALQAILEIMNSKYGYFGYIDDNGDLVCPSLTKDIWDQCQITQKSIVFPRKIWGGLWGKSLIEKKTLYSNGSLQVPEGHIPLFKVLVVPIIYHGEVVGQITVGNKATDYDYKDKKKLETIANNIAPILNAKLQHYREEKKRKQAEEELQKHRDHLEMLVEERTAELTRLNEQLQSLSSQLLTSQEKERKRVAQELHDSVGQTLSALKYSVESALNQASKEVSVKFAQSIESLIPKIQYAVEEVGKIGKGLRPSVLDDLGIIATFSWFCREFEETYSDIQVKRKITLKEADVPDSLKVVIYRILQESLNNTAKHSKADLVGISLKKTDSTIEFSIKDNGNGFDVVNTLLPENNKCGLGLISMIKRAELSGGSLVIHSDRERGTAIQVSWPV